MIYSISKYFVDDKAITKTPSSNLYSNMVVIMHKKLEVEILTGNHLIYKTPPQLLYNYTTYFLK